MQRANPERCGVTVAKPLLLAAVACCTTGCFQNVRLHMRAHGPEQPALVALDQLWEQPLFTLRGAVSPDVPSAAHARCLPARRCLAQVRSGDAAIDMRLVVVGLEVGPALVELRYRQPESRTWLLEKLYFEFAPARRFAALALGAEVPRERFALERISEAITAHGLRAPVHCELVPELINGFGCFEPERFGDIVRYPSCASTHRCGLFRGGYMHGGFWLFVRGVAGRATRFEFVMQRVGGREVVDTWGASNTRGTP